MDGFYELIGVFLSIPQLGFESNSLISTDRVILVKGVAINLLV